MEEMDLDDNDLIDDSTLDRIFVVSPSIPSSSTSSSSKVSNIPVPSTSSSSSTSQPGNEKTTTKKLRIDPISPIVSSIPTPTPTPRPKVVRTTTEQRLAYLAQNTVVPKATPTSTKVTRSKAGEEEVEELWDTPPRIVQTKKKKAKQVSFAV
jgi:hypothetical protein